MKAAFFCLLLPALAFGKSDLDLSYSATCEANNLATISFVGDVLIHEALYEVVVNETKHFSQLWQKTQGLMTKADFSLGNLEGPAAMGIDGSGKDHGDIGFVYDDNVYSGTHFLFNYHPRILSDLKNTGFDMMTSANNHALDRLSIGVDKTILAANAAGIPTIGTRLSTDSNGVFYKIATINNIRVAFLGCTEMLNGGSDPKNQVLKCYSDKTISIIKELNARSDIDAVVVFTHWGTEYSHTPDQSQKDYAKKYVEAGAVAVIGSHPHVLQPWEKYVASDGHEALILYSLGNFVAGQAGLDRKVGPVAYLGLAKNGNAKARIFGVGYTPTYRTGAVINPIGSGDSKDVLNHIAGMYGTKARIEPTEALLPNLCTKIY